MLPWWGNASCPSANAGCALQLMRCTQQSVCFSTGPQAFERLFLTLLQKPSPKEVQAYGTQLVMPPPAPAVAVAQQQQAQQRKGRVPPKWLLSLAPGGVRRGGSDGLAGALAKDGEGDAGARKQWSEDEVSPAWSHPRSLIFF